MHHTQPQAVTLVLSGYPELREAMSAIHMQADEVLVKPMEIASLKKLHPSKTRQPGASEIPHYRDCGRHLGA
jgi:ActR/RegA family two-component response regulator